MKVKFATTWNECEAIIQKHGHDMTVESAMYSENLNGINRNNEVRKSGETILHKICHPRHVQTQHLKFLLQCAQDHIR